jgi:predicted nuclease with TOPRIM domain
MPEMPTLPEMPAAPIAPEVNQNFHEKFDIDINQTVSHAMESAAVGYERIVEIFEHNRDKTRELREEQRELAYNLRDVEREKRDLNYQLARASDERKAEIIKDLKSLEKQESKLNEDKVKITDKTNELVKKQKEEQSKRIEHRAQYYQQLTVKLTETLCLYGNGLKELPKQEHVSVILKSAGEQSSGRYKDSILVFTKEDIASCSADKISAAKLMEKSQAYQF